MTTGTKVSGKTGNVLFNSVKLAGRLGGTIGQSNAVVDAGDADGPASALGAPKLPEVTIECSYLDLDTAQLAVTAAQGNDTAVAFEVHPNGTGSSKTKISTTAVLAGYELNLDINGVEKMKFTFACKAPLVWGTQT